jgi:signal transduction histidine kinase
MFSMINGVLNYSLVNKTEQVIEPVSLNALINNIQSDLELLIDEKKAIVHLEQLPDVEGSSVLLYQLFYNLLNNSLKFSKEDGRPLIRISAIADPEGNDAIIRLEDNGIGFDARYAEMIFQSFTRLNSKDKYEGTGLGLSLCRRIAERHGGRIDADGRPNIGATFYIHLPLHQTKTSL